MKMKKSHVLLLAALDLIHSGWLHYSYYSASVRSFRSLVAETRLTFKLGDARNSMNPSFQYKKEDE